MPVKRRAATPPADAISAKRLKAKERDERAERRSAIRDQAQSLHNQEPRDQNGRLKHFPFLRLPAEIRNAIYEYVFSGNEYVFSELCTEEDVTKVDESFNECNLGLLATSRQLHAETRLLPYKLAKFYFYFECPQTIWSWSVGRFVDLRTTEQEGAMRRNMKVDMFNHDLGRIMTFYGTTAHAQDDWSHIP